MTEIAEPKIGDSIPISKFFVSKMNIRAEEQFGKTDEDFTLTQHLTKQDLVQPIIARPEGSGFGIVIGRRRFLAKKKAGAKKLVVGEDVLIRNLTDEQALDDSIRENLSVFRQELNPIARAKAIQKLLETREASLRELGRTWKMPIANLSDWMTVLELSAKMQSVVGKGLIYFTDAVNIARAGISKEVQDRLADTAELKGYDAFKKEYSQLPSAKERRGLPAGKYEILRITWDKTDKQEHELYQKLEQLAKVTGKETEEMAKIIIRERLEKTR